MKKLPTVTIALSAYNEEENIKNFLSSIIAQKEDGFILEKILIISDGSTDKTVDIARSIKNNKLEIKEYKTRVGKSTRLNEIYESLRSDILIQTDCDVIFEGPYVARDMVMTLSKNAKIGMCGGNPMPMKGRTFTEKAVNATCEIYIDFRKSIRGGNNQFSADGRLLAYRKELVKKINVPKTMIANDLYTYFCCLTQGYQYKFVESAVVCFRSPKTLKDQIKQSTRFLASRIRMSRYFPKNLVKNELQIPLSILLKSMLKLFIKHPILCSYIFLVNKYCAVRASAIEKSLTAKWTIAGTTKNLNLAK